MNRSAVALLELDRRYQLDGGIFYLVPDELQQLINGEVFNDVITTRKMKRERVLQIEVPDVIFSDSLDQIGTLMSIDAVDTLTGVGVSAGVATGEARVLLTPADAHPSDRNYILVCPSTDPAWTPLFFHAAGLVMERGGTFVTRGSRCQRVWCACCGEHSERNPPYH